MVQIMIPRRLRLSPRPPVVVLSETVQDAALTAFAADDALTPNDLIAAVTFALAIFVVASEDDDLAAGADSPTLDAAVAALRHAVNGTRELDRLRRRIQ